LTEKKEDSLFPSFKKRKLKRDRLTIKKEHREVVAPPGQ
jgi:hypothetical protein